LSDEDESEPAPPPAQMRDHFTLHDMTNPLRPMANAFRIVTDIITEGSGYIFGVVNGKKSWNESKTKLLMSLLDRQARLSGQILEARMRMLAVVRGDSEYGATGGGKRLVASRHANGAAASRSKYNRK
jgi:hypothetical protein